MSVTPVRVPDAAASPTHPEHARWVKERTLALEVDHAQSAGGTLRDAETANARNLERLANRRKVALPPPRFKAPEPNYRECTHEELRAAKVRKRPAKIVPVRKHMCGGACGLCLDCKRLARVALIRDRLPGEPRLAPVVNALAVLAIAFGLRRRFRDAGVEFPFDSQREAVRCRAHDSAVSQILDRTTPILGDWR